MMRWQAILFLALFLIPLGAETGVLVSAPDGVGFFEFKEKLSVKGCGSARTVDGMTFEAFGDATWEATFPGPFALTGTMLPTDAKGRKWALFFDSEAAYVGALEDEASGLCQAVVSIANLEIKVFEIKFDKDRTGAKLKLKSKAEGSSSRGDGKGKHALKAKGPFGDSL